MTCIRALWAAFDVLAGILCAPNMCLAAMPTPAPTSTPFNVGPCKSPALASIAVRPGIGRAPATSGAVCVAPPGAAVIGVGYRDQTTIGSGRQHLEVYPAPVALLGLAERVELILAPGLTFSRRTGVSGSTMLPASGQQDAGFGAQFLVSDRPAVQQALAVVATLPTGYPTGPSGFSSGAPSYVVSYALTLNVSSTIGLSTSQGLLVAAGANPQGISQRFIAYQPTLNLSYAVASPTTLLLEDQMTAPTGPHGTTGNRMLLAVVQTLSPNIVLDAEYEINLLPPPGFNQRAFGTGITVRL